MLEHVQEQHERAAGDERGVGRHREEIPNGAHQITGGRVVVGATGHGARPRGVRHTAPPPALVVEGGGAYVGFGAAGGRVVAGAVAGGGGADDLASVVVGLEVPAGAVAGGFVAGGLVAGGSVAGGADGPGGFVGPAVAGGASPSRGPGGRHTVSPA